MISRAIHASYDVVDGSREGERKRDMKSSECVVRIELAHAVCAVISDVTLFFSALPPMYKNTLTIF